MMMRWVVGTGGAGANCQQYTYRTILSNKPRATTFYDEVHSLPSINQWQAIIPLKPPSIVLTTMADDSVDPLHADATPDLIRVRWETKCFSSGTSHKEAVARGRAINDADPHSGRRTYVLLPFVPNYKISATTTSTTL